MAHPSYPNDLALTSGSTWGIASDTLRTIDAIHIGDLLEERGKSWKIYAGGYPGHCVLGRKAGAYARKHVPFLSYRNVQGNSSRCARVVGANELQTDVEMGTLPDFAMYIPNNAHNGHDTGVARADRYIERIFGPQSHLHRALGRHDRGRFQAYRRLHALQPAAHHRGPARPGAAGAGGRQGYTDRRGVALRRVTY